jgi:tetratricopeptide (TPR) repeat protein
MDLSMSIVLALALTLGQDPPGGQTLMQARQLYDAGKYQEAIAAIDKGPIDANKARLQYLAAQSYDKLKDTAGARRRYQGLADSGGDAAWKPIGKSALLLMDQKLADALTSADDAVRLGASVPEAHYQRGIVLMTRKDYPNAAGAFAKATQLDPTFASAFYYAGLANYRANRIDLMTNNFEKFVKLAPNAPERPEVESILRTLRGR